MEVGELNFEEPDTGDDGPVLIKFNVPYSDIIIAMDLLRQRFKTSDTFFPGYEGVARAMKDHANYQIVKQRIDRERPDCHH